MNKYVSLSMDVSPLAVPSCHFMLCFREEEAETEVEQITGTL
jgi:hypothetical protein